MRILVSIFTLIVTLGERVEASPQFNEAPFLKEAVQNSQSVFTAHVVSRSEEWSCGGRIVSKARAKEIYEYGFKRQSEFGNYQIDPEAAKQIDAYYKSEEGREWISLTCRIIVSLRLDEELVGDSSDRKKDVVTCAWSISFGLICPHVGVDAAPGDDVVVFLKDGWSDQVVINPKLFQIGAHELKDKVVAVSSESGTTKLSTEQAGDAN